MTVIEILQKDLREIIKRREDAISSGQVKDWIEYQHLLGVLVGLKSALARVDSLMKNYIETD